MKMNLSPVLVFKHAVQDRVLSVLKSIFICFLKSSEFINSRGISRIKVTDLESEGIIFYLPEVLH